METNNTDNTQTIHNLEKANNAIDFRVQWLYQSL